ncbi:Oligopeptide transport system permease protein OppB [Pelotomaculum schinkii]|uniref:Oligopeptide transport system permease protein OppB n=1 Tax=Pelotomaculum schinkii TaxID=78350 RepID=A0A4Y7RH09_9FIRM|nr:ABC transporter permease [Pelotomaculum schinkii]TEB08040.1 Oligopeptide transport system permease protein OppB [Pelotomaculum schinkii]
MAGYILKRAVFNLGVMFVVVTLTFFLMRLLPGDPFTTRRVAPEIKDNILARYGLNQPLVTQYTGYLYNLARLDLGPSLKYPGRSVNDIIKESFPVSATVGLLALLLSIVLGVSLGVASAALRNKWPDRLVLVLATLGMSVPNFALGAGLIYIFALKLRWLPAAMSTSPVGLVLPALTLAALPAAIIVRLVRTEMIEALDRDYIVAARARGLNSCSVLFRHALPNALSGMVHYLSPLAATLLTGSFIVEKIFALPGLGQYYVTSVGNRDYNLVAGVTIFYTFVLLVSTFLADVLIFLINPQSRVRDEVT